MFAVEEEVVSFRIAEWQEGLRITSVPQAMAQVGAAR